MIDVIFSDGHTEQIANAIEWLNFMQMTQDMETNYWATITSEMYDTAIDELSTIDDGVADRVKIIIQTAKENNIESLVFT